METAGESRSARVPTLPEMVTRTLRHEVGDLLQTVYASVAILQERLPVDMQLERRIIKDLRGRAEECKHLLDTVHDLVCPLSLSCESIDPGELAANLVNTQTVRHPRLAIRAEVKDSRPLVADPRHLSQLGNRLLAYSCQRAERQVVFRTTGLPEQGEVRWTVEDDGPPVPPEQFERLTEPFQTTRPGTLGLDLALAHKLAELHGGRLSVRNRPEGGFAVEVSLPVQPTGCTP